MQVGLSSSLHVSESNDQSARRDLNPQEGQAFLFITRPPRVRILLISTSAHLLVGAYFPRLSGRPWRIGRAMTRQSIANVTRRPEIPQ
jgi:hypothetical protein